MRGAIIRTGPPATSAEPRKLRLAPARFGTADGIGCLLVLSAMHDVYSTMLAQAAQFGVGKCIFDSVRAVFSQEF